MTINTLYQQKSVSSQQTLGINQVFTIDAAATVDGNTVYRKVLFLRLPADAAAQQLVLKNAALAANFSAYTFNVSSASGFLKPQGWKQKEGKTIVRFQRAWPIDRINSNSHNTFALYRVDGDAVVDEATVSGSTNSSKGAGFFTSHEFAVELSSVATLELAIENSLSAVTTRTLMRKSSLPGQVSDSADEFLGVIGNSATNYLTGLRSVGILGMPTTPRIGIVQDAALGADVEAGNYAAAKIDWLSLTPGEHANAVVASVGVDVLPRLQAVVDARYKAEPGNTVIVPLVFESDTPCRCTLNQIQFGYALRSVLFGDAQAEKKLRFSGATIDGQQIPLILPRGVIESVSLAVNDAAQDQLAVGVSAEAAQRKSVKGAFINVQQAVAARVSLPAATVVRGVSIAVNTLSAATSIEVTLIEDRNDNPSGAVLASAALQVDSPGRRQFLNIAFDASTDLLLDQKPYWLLVRATSGSLLWLSSTASASQKVLLLKDLQSSTAISGVTQAARAIAGIALEYGWIFNRDAADGINVTFSIGSQPVPLANDASEVARHFLQLPAVLAQPTVATPVVLTVIRASAGIVSLSALRIDYLPQG